MKVLFLSQWYPHRYDSMSGLFVQKHAEAVSLYCDVSVLYVHADDKIKEFEIVRQQQNNITEYIVYYPIKAQAFFRKFKKVINLARAYKIGFRELKRDGFKYDLMHANILTRTPLISYVCFLKNKTPYVITEHWSRYLPERNQFKGQLRKLLARIVVKNAKAVLPVSENLKKSMLSFRLYNDNYQVVNNVVEDFFFEDHIKEKREKKRIIHISCFDEKAKNMKGMLRVVEQLNKKRQDFELLLVGAGVDYDEIQEYYTTLNLKEGTVKFLGELPPKYVAHYLKNSDFSCMFSNYENVPVVISESLACGIPVVSTDVGGIKEHVNDTNGILIPVKDEKAFKEALNYMLDHFQHYDSHNIMINAKESYSFDKVGKKLYNIYLKSM